MAYAPEDVPLRVGLEDSKDVQLCYHGEIIGGPYVVYITDIIGLTDLPWLVSQSFFQILFP
ncbi:MAG: hypothetical protein QG670_1386 [Thermoproteota archaeon]|nr:hypothetical protein [Thermoproteota archaeon]